MQKLILASSNLAKSVQYWHETLGLKLLEKTNEKAIVAFKEEEVKLELKEIGCAVTHETAGGRIAFSVPESELKVVSDQVTKTGDKILTPLVKLDTPGKASVTVIILADPVGSNAFVPLARTAYSPFDLGTYPLLLSSSSAPSLSVSILGRS